MIIWLASYPKSGNTWLRAFLSYYCYGKVGEFKEAAHGKFFRKGKINQWKENLPKKIIKKLEDSFSDVMFENKYLF